MMSQNNRCFTLSTYLNAFANLTLKSSSKKNLFNSLLPISEQDFICLALFNATLKELSFLFFEEFILQHASEAVCDRRRNGFSAVTKKGFVTWLVSSDIQHGGRFSFQRRSQIISDTVFIQ